MQRECRQCREIFEVTEDDLAFYDKVSPVFEEKKYSIPPPTLCTDCQHQRRLAHRNERHLHRRKCDLTGEEIISFYSKYKPWKVYAPDAWWSDRWNPLFCGQPFDSQRSFFDQYAALQQNVPRIGMVISHCENCDFAPYSVYSRNCYMSPSNVGSEDLCYCYQTNDSRNCVDCSLCTQCELCYECLHCTGLRTSGFSEYCENSQDLLFSTDCRNCSDCIACKNLIGKKNHLFNQPASPEEIASLKTQLRSIRERETFRGKVREFFSTLPVRGSHHVNCEHCTGDNLINCRNARACFDAKGLEDCAYCYNIPKGAKDVRGAHYSPNAELVYDSMSAVNGYRVLFALHSWDCKECMYVDECFYCERCFGCIGLKHKEYCILNKQYTKEAFEELLPTIIDHMRSTGEWGEYFPITLSPYSYNETIAMERFPLSLEEVQEREWSFEKVVEEIPKVDRSFGAEHLPEDIDKVPDDILSWAIECERTRRPFRIVRQELAFYRKAGIPIPHLHPDERYRRRMNLRNPRKLWNRNCMKCGKEMQTTYAPERPEKVYCESCYLAEVY